ncbi:MAG: cupin domain-containing protein [Burkholderiaceae bacterium]|nr:cupin domain-containing protein [Burkholderiaceae bacterium]
MKHVHCTILLGSLLASIAAAPAPAAAQGTDAKLTVTTVDATTWGPAPKSLPPGAQAAMLLGHPTKEGPFVMRLKFPAGFVVPPHRHSKDEFVTVISGQFAITNGEKVDRAAAKPLPAGSFVHIPAGTPHYAWVGGETVVQIIGMGPFDVKYVDPTDDPRSQ